MSKKIKPYVVSVEEIPVRRRSRPRIFFGLTSPYGGPVPAPRSATRIALPPVEIPIMARPMSTMSAIDGFFRMPFEDDGFSDNY